MADIVAGSSLDRQSALRYRSGTVRLVRAGAGVAGARGAPSSPRAAPAALRRPASRAAPGRPAGWSSRIVLPPPRTPLSAFYRHARLYTAVAVLFYLFCPKIWQIISYVMSGRRAWAVMQREVCFDAVQRRVCGKRSLIRFLQSLAVGRCTPHTMLNLTMNFSILFISLYRFELIVRMFTNIIKFKYIWLISYWVLSSIYISTVHSQCIAVHLVAL